MPVLERGEPGDVLVLDAVALRAELGDCGIHVAGVPQDDSVEDQAQGGAKRRGIDEAVNYLTSKAEHLRYDTALENGWPIATGIIEGACRHLAKDRLDITGARWGLSGAEAVLKLRAVRVNGDFEAYWAWHERHEFTRNHQARYRDRLILTA